MTKLATFETTKGTIVAELYPAEAPKTVENFEKLANSGFYDGVKFHRVIQDFVVQGGDPHKHAVGALSMAHAGKDTGGSQFFMVLSESNTRHLNGVHTVFGQITGGLDVMKKIAQDDAMTSVRVTDAD